MERLYKNFGDQRIAHHHRALDNDFSDQRIAHHHRAQKYGTFLPSGYPLVGICNHLTYVRICVITNDGVSMPRFFASAS